MKNLYRSRSNRMVAGVIGGFGTYFQVSSTLLRFAFVIFLICTGIFPGVFIYLAAVFMIPKETLIVPSKPVSEPSADSVYDTESV